MEPVEDVLLVRERRAGLVGVLEAQDERAAGLAREEVVEERGPRGADVERAGGARRDADARRRHRRCGGSTRAPSAVLAHRAAWPRLRASSQPETPPMSAPTRSRAERGRRGRGRSLRRMPRATTAIAAIAVAANAPTDDRRGSRAGPVRRCRPRGRRPRRASSDEGARRRADASSRSATGSSGAAAVVGRRRSTCGQRGARWRPRARARRCRELARRRRRGRSSGVVGRDRVAGSSWSNARRGGGPTPQARARRKRAAAAASCAAASSSATLRASRAGHDLRAAIAERAARRQRRLVAAEVAARGGRPGRAARAAERVHVTGRARLARGACAARSPAAPLRPGWHDPSA